MEKKEKYCSNKNVNIVASLAFTLSCSGMCQGTFFPKSSPRCPSKTEPVTIYSGVV
jgi:hypothetical protein